MRAALFAVLVSLSSHAQTPGTVIEFPVAYPNETSVETGARDRRFRRLL